MSHSFDETMMMRALAIARGGRPSPNPHVGAVLVRDGKILATGYHHRAGLAHAEVDALRKLGHSAPGATLYVTLEPCNHHGRTGPCSEALIKAGVARVVVGCEDRVPGHGGGAERLREAGVEVQMGVCRAEAEALVADFYRRTLEGLPFVTLKAALTLDGRMATRSSDSRWITGDEARKHAHRMRDRSDAILVGVGTVLADDPELTVRHVRGQHPIRVVLDTALRTPPQAKLLRAEGKTWIFHAFDADPERAAALRERGALLLPAARRGAQLDLEEVLRELARRQIVRLLVEGGPTVHGALLDAGLVNRVALFFAPRLLADPQALPLAFGRPKQRMTDALELENESLRHLGRDLLIEGDLRRQERREG